MASILPIYPNQDDASLPSNAPAPTPEQRNAPKSSTMIDLADFRPCPAKLDTNALSLEILAGPGQGTVHRFNAPLLIGHSPRCGLIIEHPSVANEHLRLEIRYGRWTAVNLNTENLSLTLKNGSPFQVTGLAVGDVFSLGEVQLRLDGNVAGVAGPQPTSLRRLLADKRLAWGASLGLGVLLAGTLLLYHFTKHSPGDPPVDAWTKEQAGQEALELRKVSALLLQARRLTEDGQYAMAKARLTSLLALDPQNEEARQILATIQEQETTRAIEARERQARTLRVRDAVRPYINEAERLLGAGDIKGASAALARALALDPNLPEAKSILAGIEAREQRQRNETMSQASNSDTVRAQLFTLQSEAQAAMVQNAPYRALVAYRQLASLEGDPTRAAEAHKKVVFLEDRLTRQVAPDLTRAQQLQGHKRYPEAYKALTQALAIFPESREAKAQLAALLPQLEQEAKRLYEEGLTEDRLGRREEAQARWRETIATMPLPDNEYRRLAEAKLQVSGSKPQP